MVAPPAAGVVVAGVVSAAVVCNNRFALSLVLFYLYIFHEEGSSID